MGHHIAAFIGKQGEATVGFQTPPFLGALDLPHGLTLTPLSHEVLDGMGSGAETEDRINDAASRLSMAGTIAYVETEYFGGVGGQAAGLWRNGVQEFSGFEGESVAFWRPETKTAQPINHALGLGFGLRPVLGDCFDALGLGNWCHIDDILVALGKFQSDGDSNE